MALEMDYQAVETVQAIVVAAQASFSATCTAAGNVHVCGRHTVSPAVPISVLGIDKE